MTDLMDPPEIQPVSDEERDESNDSYLTTDFNAVLSQWLHDVRKPGRHRGKRRTAS